MQLSVDITCQQGDSKRLFPLSIIYEEIPMNQIHTNFIQMKFIHLCANLRITLKENKTYIFAMQQNRISYFRIKHISRCNKIV